MSLSTIVDWLTWREATPVAKTKTYIDLPVFTYATSWLGASEITTQFNFTSSKNFVLKNRPSTPSGVNYCLCIRYRIGNTVYRWKLWEGVGEALQAPLYNGEIIKKNFVLEVWTTNNVSADNAAALRILTSVVNVPTDFRSLGNTALCTGVEYNKASVAISASTPTDLATTYMSAWYRADAGITESGNRVSAWADQSSNAYNLEQATAASKPLYVSSDADINSKPLISFDDSTRMMQYITGAAVPVTVKQVFLVLSQETFVTGKAILVNSTDIMYQDGTTPTIRLTDGTLTFTNSGATVDTWCILEIKITATKVTFIVYSLSGTIIQTSEYITASWLTNASGNYLFQIGNNLASGAVFKIAEAIFYNTVVDTANVLAYFTYKYTGVGTVVSIPLTIPAGSAWLDNT